LEHRQAELESDYEMGVAIQVHSPLSSLMTSLYAILAGCFMR